MPYTWHAVDLLTGKRGPQLQMETRGQVSRIIGESTDTQGSVVVWDAAGRTERSRTKLLTNLFTDPNAEGLGVRSTYAASRVNITKSNEWAASGRQSFRLERYAADNLDGFMEVTADVMSQIKPNTTYTIMGTCWLPKLMAVGSDGQMLGTQTLSIFAYFNGGEVTALPTARNIVGQAQTLRATFTTPSSLAGYNTIRFYNGGQPGDVVHWDSLLLVEGSYAGPYFDGDSVLSDSELCSWDGLPNASTSSKYFVDYTPGAAFPEWRYWTQPGRMLMLLVDDDDRPIWGGVILRRIPDHTTKVPLSMATLEHYLDRRYSGALVRTNTDQAAIAAALVQATVSNTGVPFIIDAKNTGQLRDRTYLDSEDKTTLSLLTDLMNLDNGIEFTVDLDWLDAGHTTLGYYLRIASRLGTALPQPVRFEHPGPVQTFQFPEDYTKDNGANDVLSVSSGEGDARPASTHRVDTAKLSTGWARYERRWTPSTSISDTNTLEAYSTSELARVKDGLVELSLVCNLDTGPRLNADWWLGDDITAAITAPAFPERIGVNGERLPGVEQRVRVVGWSIDLDARTMTPTVRMV